MLYAWQRLICEITRSTDIVIEPEVTTTLQSDALTEKETRAGALYDMDRIYWAADKEGHLLFFDGEMEKIPSIAISK